MGEEGTNPGVVLEEAAKLMSYYSSFFWIALDFRNARLEGVSWVVVSYLL